MKTITNNEFLHMLKRELSEPDTISTKTLSELIVVRDNMVKWNAPNYKIAMVQYYIMRAKGEL